MTDEKEYLNDRHLIRELFKDFKDDVRADLKEMKEEVDKRLGKVDDRLEKVEGHQIAILSRKPSPAPLSAGGGAASVLSRNQLIAVVSTVLGVFGSMLTVFVQQMNVSAKADQIESHVSEQSREQVAALARALTAVSKATAAQAAGAKTLTTLDSNAAEAAEQEAQSAAKDAIQAEHTMVMKQAETAASPKEKQKVQTELADIRVRAKKLDTTLE